jgi:hypothetical protein
MIYRSSGHAACQQVQSSQYRVPLVLQDQREAGVNDDHRKCYSSCSNHVVKTEISTLSIIFRQIARSRRGATANGGTQFIIFSFFFARFCSRCGNSVALQIANISITIVIFINGNTFTLICLILSIGFTRKCHMHWNSTRFICFFFFSTAPALPPATTTAAAVTAAG